MRRKLWMEVYILSPSRATAEIMELIDDFQFKGFEWNLFNIEHV